MYTRCAIGGPPVTMPGTRPHSTRPVQRLSVNLSPEVAEALQWIAEKHGSTVTEAVRRCISTQKYIEEALDKKAKILIAEEGQPVRELVFVP
jgi:predicted DNA-binding protein